MEPVLLLITFITEDYRRRIITEDYNTYSLINELAAVSLWVFGQNLAEKQLTNVLLPA